MAQNYRETLNLPKDEHTIPMRANLPEQEPRWQAFWHEQDLYAQLLAKPAPNGDFILHDGPPYSNGNIHMGHALNKVLKDIIVRSYAMRGYRTPYVPGWDNHGMPIENAVSQQFLQQGKTPSKVELRQACRAYAQHFVEVQRKQFERLGLVGDWEHPYLTMDYAFEAGIVRIFGELVKRGYIYRDLRPVLWCPVCQTALAEAEVEYAPKVSDAIYVAFPIVRDPKGIFANAPNPAILIWTTTPWTIPANLALAVHPELDYALVATDGKTWVLVNELVPATMETLGVKEYRVLTTVKGSELEGVVARHPIFERESPVVLADYVLAEEGTGVVHTAPGHGAEDFYTGKRYGLPILCPVDERGVFTEEAGEFAGLPIAPEGNRAVIRRLQEVGALLHYAPYHHNYPHCWRCDSPLLFRTTVQWFMNIDHMGHREKALRAIEGVRWIPEEGENRIKAMVANRPDWCLSRQRAWGVGIPAFYCEACDEVLLTPETIEAVAQKIEQEGSDVWFDKPADYFLPAGTRCAKCGASQFRKETDVLDVWFDSGSTHRLVLETRPELRWPADLYIEGSDQHRGWFNASLMIAIGTKDAAPYRMVITHGFVLDGEGRKMSKSEGNVVDPLDVVQKMGADVLRLWVASTEYFEDVRLSDEILKYVADAYRQIRNTLRFIIGNLADFNPATDAVPYERLHELDRWMLARLQEYVRYALQAYESFEYHRFYHETRRFCNVDLSAFYLDVLKDRLYASAPDDPARRSAQTVLLELASVLTRLLAPILVHTAEEVWQRLPLPNKPASVHLAEFPTAREEWLDKSLLERWERILEVREVVNRAVESAKNEKRIPNPQSAKVVVHAPGGLYALLSQYPTPPTPDNLLARVFGVSQAEVVPASDEAIQVVVEPAPGNKCARCWLVLPEVGTRSDYPDLCARCAQVVAALA
ncbi:Isoleucyl-tRNA synthetase [Armatimonadetes bacterium GBS]|jgi:isoleucyl-tRNA synthetase|nr:MAG: isoleucine--tRNA ligase [Fimbriimonadales bacterium]CUU01882.1 Isoleucyl-tRNA synthetase [Armatimonadetes bacterium GBS]